jgi:hypothetical protein
VQYKDEHTNTCDGAVHTVPASNQLGIGDVHSNSDNQATERSALKS